MAVIPVKWNWEDKLDKENEKEYNELLCDIIHRILNEIDKTNNEVRKLKKRQNRLEKEFRVIIKKNNNSY